MSRRTPSAKIVRLACVKHAASVRPEPGSNSPSKNRKTNPPTPHQSRTSERSRPKTTTRTPRRRDTSDPSTKQNIWYQQTWHTIEFSNNRPRTRTRQGPETREVDFSPLPWPGLPVPAGATQLIYLPGPPRATPAPRTAGHEHTRTTRRTITFETEDGA